ncbi:hypothetical protein DXO170_19010 [Xanthomonas oryzae pv. oryzae]|nr:hypothetical protein BO993_08005 [Xanthomonas oryzae pv. oryzae]OLG46306.1 hypothetical protein BXO33_07555 [Xanthomonas oryzae pv. oryzae]OLG47461.1 hypothetical protein BXO25_08235 [Xanthomonas oryzae pv. oryzae]OLG53148.1 hypothetical protein BXO34_14725 [Xanthomonas oryzae pv. oryzae]OLG63135.1 hypothetical protein BXO439_17540 [Xanthomonas oryzae pv. oryzae]
MVNGEVDLIGGRELLRVDTVELLEHAVPHGQSRLLRGRADVGQMGVVAGGVAVFVGLAGLGLAPGPLFFVDGAEARVGGCVGGERGRSGRCGGLRRGGDEVCAQQSERECGGERRGHVQKA